jgi:hypothetical protein
VIDEAILEHERAHAMSLARVGDHVISGHRGHRRDRPLGSAPAGSQIVRIPGLQAGPLGRGTSIGTEILLTLKPLWPAGRRVLPRLLPPVETVKSSNQWLLPIASTPRIVVQ